MSRIQKAYETRFRWLLQRVRARRLEEGVLWLVQKARVLGERENLAFADALMEVHQQIASRPFFADPRPTVKPDVFFCDAGLGGLARWLRAAGHDARWEPGIDDDDLLKKARELSAVILTTDSMLMERRLLRDRVIPAFWMPPTLKIPEQLSIVFREFRLQVQEHRCMTCGGTLVKGDKQALKEKIPPRTYRWLDEYFLCTRCGKLYWHGTHWNRIHRQLDVLA